MQEQSAALPAAFEARMRQMLGDEYDAFEKSMREEDRYRSLRVNTLKTDPGTFAGQAAWRLQPVPWEPAGFYYREEDRPGRHPWHETGMYYIQEPSAMAVSALAGARPGERVLDLCAAPGGKTTGLAAAMEGRGLLAANEIHPQRARILSQNIERMGISNALVINEDPHRLAEQFPAYFDRIIVDAPCSGEGMFRKEPQAIPNWSPDNVRLCAERQQDILEQAVSMLADGGTLVYSTCTFAPEEDEETICRLLCAHPELTCSDLPAELGERMQVFGFDSGHPEWITEEAAGRALRPDGTFYRDPHKRRQQAAQESRRETARAGPDHAGTLAGVLGCMSAAAAPGNSASVRQRTVSAAGRSQSAGSESPAAGTPSGYF